MRRRQAIALLGLSALWPLWSRAQSAPSAVDAVAEIGKRLGKPRLLRGNFLQRKSLTGFNRPLLSQGEFLFAPGQGVLWHTRTPFETWLRITPNSISERGADGPATHVSASMQPALRELNAMMLAVLSGDTARLGERFQLEGKLFGSYWQLRARPREAGLAANLRVIELGGSSIVERVSIEEANGDRTEISFSAVSSQPERLSGEEAARLEGKL